MTVTTPIALDRHWPAEGVTRVPFWAYSDLSVYEVMKLSQDGIAPAAEAVGVLEMGGRGTENTD